MNAVQSTPLPYYTTTLLPYYPTTLLPYYPTTLLPYYHTTLLHYYPTTLPYYPTTLLPYYPTTLLPYYPTATSISVHTSMLYAWIWYNHALIYLCNVCMISCFVHTSICACTHINSISSSRHWSHHPHDWIQFARLPAHKSCEPTKPGLAARPFSPHTWLDAVRKTRHAQILRTYKTRVVRKFASSQDFPESLG